MIGSDRGRRRRGIALCGHHDQRRGEGSSEETPRGESESCRVGNSLAASSASAFGGARIVSMESPEKLNIRRVELTGTPKSQAAQADALLRRMFGEDADLDKAIFSSPPEPIYDLVVDANGEVTMVPVRGTEID